MDVVLTIGSSLWSLKMTITAWLKPNLTREGSWGRTRPARQPLASGSTSQKLAFRYSIQPLFVDIPKLPTHTNTHTHTHFRTSTEVKAAWAGFCNGKKGIHKIHMQDGIHCYVVSGCFDVPWSHDLTGVVQHSEYICVVLDLCNCVLQSAVILDHLNSDQGWAPLDFSSLMYSIHVP